MSSPLTRSPILARNALLNVLGYGLPLLVALFAIPRIVSALGTDRFGVLTLAWVLIGYLSLLDLGMGRALTQVVAAKLGNGQNGEMPATIWTALAAMGAIGLCTAVGFGLSAGWFVDRVLKIPSAIAGETITAFRMLSIMVPVVIVSVGLRGVLEAYQRFDLVNAVRIPMGVFSFIAPLLVIPFSIALPHIIVVLFAGRLIGAAVQFRCVTQVVQDFTSGRTFKRALFIPLLKFGGWMTVTNVIHPLLYHLDRFFIAALIPLPLWPIMPPRAR